MLETKKQTPHGVPRAKKLRISCILQNAKVPSNIGLTSDITLMPEHEHNGTPLSLLTTIIHVTQNPISDGLLSLKRRLRAHGHYNGTKDCYLPVLLTEVILLLEQAYWILFQVLNILLHYFCE